MKKKKAITVQEAKLVVPIELDTYEFKPYCLYLFVAKPQTETQSGINPVTLSKLKDLLNTNNIRGVFIVAELNDLKIYELKPEG